MAKRTLVLGYGEIMKNRFIYKTILILIIPIPFLITSVLVHKWYQTSCWKDHSKPAKELGVPMEKQVSLFFKKYRRFPDIKESGVLLEKSGCISMKQTYHESLKDDTGEVYQQLASYNCSHNSLTYKYSLRIPEPNTKETFNTGAYVIGFSQGNTHCRADYSKDGTLQSSFSCQQFPCFKLDH